MPRQNQVKRLPSEIRQQVDRLLHQGATVDQITDSLQALGHDISRSAAGRYAQEYRQVADRMRETREMAAGFAAELGSLPEDETHQTLVQMLHSMLMRFGMAELQNEESSVDAKELSHLARTIKDLMGSVKDRQAVRAQAKKEAREEAAEQAASAAAAEGMSADAIERVKRDILGAA